ncbi:hypothetical protein [Nostoc sp. JL23]|uniref:hypothetical protein n=1 Tax=Nostoc sp. JL23 TaxID=2815394 RepID=UPI001DBD0088|nr:hypothetical protein [Nostoc sp. JL23]MBN3875187.1 hypothetical protein [Nostoc sp. JL23]
MTTDPNELAYPIHAELPQGASITSRGLTKREFFASQILAGLVSQGNPRNIEWLPGEAVKLADKLVDELNKD